MQLMIWLCVQTQIKEHLGTYSCCIEPDYYPVAHSLKGAKLSKMIFLPKMITKVGKRGSQEAIISIQYLKF